MGEVVRFPVERRQPPVLGTAVKVEGDNVTVDVSGHGAMVWRGQTTFVTVGGPPSWWAKVPEVTLGQDDRRMWMKLGRSSGGTRTKRHRVIAIIVQGGTHLIATAACGRKSELSVHFNDPWTGGDCETCRSKGWR